MNLKKLLNNDFQFKITDQVKATLKNKTILITGAAGSIGSEISKIIAEENCCELILLDQAESDLYNLQQELILKNCKNHTIVVGDVCDKALMEVLYKKYQPQIVYHIAAYKHVPLMEDHPYLAVKVNVLGTKIIADLSKKYSVLHFILVSTDKAVNPVSVMGATKRIAELYVGNLNDETSKVFKVVRFGNVPYSKGSVIPLFKKQLYLNQKITITDTMISRYFITMKNVCKLLIQALVINDCNLLIYNMGKSVPIEELAIKLIEQEGLAIENIKIEKIGLRPGEKLNEEIVYGDEIEIRTDTKADIKKYNLILDEDINTKIKKLTAITPDFSREKIIDLLQEIVPQYS